MLDGMINDTAGFRWVHIVWESKDWKRRRGSSKMGGTVNTRGSAAPERDRCFQRCFGLYRSAFRVSAPSLKTAEIERTCRDLMHLARSLSPLLYPRIRWAKSGRPPPPL